MSETYLRSAFKNWISTPGKASDKPIPPAQVDMYVNALKFSSTKLIGAKLQTTDLFSCVTIDDFESAHKIIRSSTNFDFVNSSSNGAFSEALDYYSLFLEDITKPVCWIFNADPKIYDIIPAVQELSTITWRVEQREKMIKANDRVYLWLPGIDGGIVAAGTLLSNPEQKDPLRNDPYVIEGDLIFDQFLGVDIRIDKRFTNPIIGQHFLKDDEQAKTLEVIQFPGAAHYLLSPVQESAIERIIEKGEFLPKEKTPAKKKTGSTQSAEAKEKPDSTKVETIKAESTQDVCPVEVSARRKKHWVFAPYNALQNWDLFYSNSFIGIGLDAIGDLENFTSKEAIKNALRAKYGQKHGFKQEGHIAWQFSKEMQVGDIVYYSHDGQTILGRGIVKSDYIFDRNRKQIKNTRQVTWTSKGEWTIPADIVTRTLTEISNFRTCCREIEEMILGLFEQPLSKDLSEPCSTGYTKEDFLKDAFMDEDVYNDLSSLLLSKKNVILTGVPGVGKTFLAERLAYSIMGKIDPDRIKFIQFHRAYNYDNFVMGYAQTDSGRKLKTGVFYDFCKEAEPDDRKYFLIIDDIGRGDISSIFGDLLNLIGSDFRNKELRLLYRDEYFSVPDNVYIIATMSTASGTDFMTDYSLRRRFAFFHIDPAFSTKSFAAYKKEVANKKMDKLVKVITDLNKAILESHPEFESFLIGHGYFSDPDSITDERIVQIAKYEIIPLIQTYFCDQPDLVKLWTGKINTAVR